MSESTRKTMVYGIGNGLVDKQVKVTDVELETLHLQKGGMELTDEAGQSKIIKSLDQRDRKLNAGGSAANTIIGLAQMGAHVAYACSVGADAHGDVYLDDFDTRGIHLTTQPKTGEATGTCLILITPDGERTMNTHLGASTLLDKSDIDEAVVADSEWLYVEGYLLSGEITKAAAYYAMDLAKKHGTKIAFTFSDGFIVEVFGEDVDRIVKEYADLVFANEREAAVYTGTRDPEASLAAILKHCASACVTLSEKGSLVHFGGKRYEVPAFPATPIDMTGAGDMYAAGFLYGICHDWSPDKAGLLGSKAAHNVVIQLGARLPGNLQGMVGEIGG